MEADEPEEERSRLSPVHHALDSFLCHEQASPVGEARDDDVNLLSALHPVQRHVSSEGL